MTDYYPLLARAVAGLEKNTGEARRALYERARNALLDQLRSATPPLTEAEITRERLALEEAVRKVEAEALRRSRLTPPRPPAPPEQPRPPAPPQQPPRSAGGEPSPTNRAPAPPREPAAQGPAPRAGGDVRGAAEPEAPGAAAAQAPRTAQERKAATPGPEPDRDREEPGTEPAIVRPPTRERPPAPPARPQAEWATPPEPAHEDLEPREEDVSARRRPVARPPRRIGGHGYDWRSNASRRGLIAAVLTVLVITSLGAAAYWQRDRISSLFGVVRNLGPQAQRDHAQVRPKIEDRVTQDGVPSSGQQPGGTSATRPGTPPPAVAQRVVLYEEDPANPEGNRYVGSALWRTETVSPGPGLSPELAIRADVEIPERRLAMTMSIRRNTDKALPASHTIEIMFNLPADFQFGGVANVPGLLMKEAEQARGAPLSGLAVKVTNGFFLIGLSAVEADVQRNVQLLQERGWFDIPIVYNNGRRAILAIEKGTPGERAFSEAFAAWKQ